MGRYLKFTISMRRYRAPLARLCIYVGVLGVTVSTTFSATAQTLYGAQGSRLILIAPSNGGNRLIGSGSFGVSGLAFDSRGRLFGGSGSRLVRINLQTGQNSVIGTGTASIAGLAFDSRDRLFGGSGSRLYRINVSTAQASLVLTGGFDIDGLAFDSRDRLFAGGGRRLYRLSPDAGTWSLIGSGTFSIDGLAFDANDRLFGVSGRRLLRVNTSTGQNAEIGLGTFSVEGLAFAPLITTFNPDYIARATTSNELAVAVAIEREALANTIALADPRSALLTLTANERAIALRDLPGDLHSGSISAISASRLQLAQVLQQRAQTSTSYAPAAGDEAPQSYVEPAGFWLAALNGFGSVDASSNAGGYDYDHVGYIGGLDGVFFSRVRAGIFVAGIKHDIDGTQSNGHLEVDSIRAGMSASYQHGAFSGQVIYSHSIDDYDARRQVRLGPSTETITADYDGRQHSFSIEGAWSQTRWETLWTPYLRFNHHSTVRDAFTERGSGVSDLAFDRLSSDTTTSTLGLRIARTLVREGFKLTPELNLGWNHFLNANDDRIGVRFNDFNQQFNIRSSELPRDSALIAGSFNVRAPGGIRGQLEYSGQINGDMANHSFMARIDVPF